MFGDGMCGCVECVCVLTMHVNNLSDNLNQLEQIIKACSRL